ncbi:hypothetical protein GW820_06415 [archaeon]|nr:hypothetical protein [archaeon]
MLTTKKTNSVDLGVDELGQVEPKPKKNEQPIKLTKHLKEFHTSKLKDLKKDLKAIEKEGELKTKLKKLVDITKDRIDKKNLTLIILQVIEDAIYNKDKDKMNMSKETLAVEVLQPLHKCDVETLKHIISLTCKTLKKTTFYRRNKHKIMKYISFFFNILLITK